MKDALKGLLIILSVLIPTVLLQDALIYSFSALWFIVLLMTINAVKIGRNETNKIEFRIFGFILIVYPIVIFIIMVYNLLN